MSGARFARAARCRFFVYISILVLMMGMLIIFHNSQLQLDEAKQQRLLCEQQQETLNDRLSCKYWFFKVTQNFNEICSHFSIG